MHVRICPDCAAHNPADAWSCARCGSTLSMNTLTQVDQVEELPPEPGVHEDIALSSQDIVLYKSENSLITTRQALIKGEVIRIDHIASVDQKITRAQESDGESRPLLADQLVGPGLAVRAIISLTGIGMTRYVLRIHLKNGRVHEYVSKSEDRVTSMHAALTEAIARAGQPI